jgi:hypothetical protein
MDGRLVTGERMRSYARKLRLMMYMVPAWFASFLCVTRSGWKTDVVIPCHPKDGDLLPVTVGALKKNLWHPIGEIFIVAPDSEGLRSFCTENSCRFVDENTVLGVRARDLDYCPAGRDRRAWLFQQLLKMSSDALGSSPFTLVLDADTVFLKPVSFERGGRLLLQFSECYHLPYWESLARLLPWIRQERVSFVCHHIFCEKRHLKDLRAAIEKAHPDLTWWKAILESMDRENTSGFADYETIGAYLRVSVPRTVMEYYMNKAGDYDRWQKDTHYRSAMRFFYRSISFHSYNRARSQA